MAPATTVFDERLPNLPKDVRAPITSYTPSMWLMPSLRFLWTIRFVLFRGSFVYVFNKFKNDDSKFEETLTSDAKGLLSLYEAANVRIHGEDVLEDAVAFTTRHLNRMVQELEPVLQCQVKRALEQPVHRGVARLEARHYISFYERNESKNEILLKLAKLDFNYLQKYIRKNSMIFPVTKSVLMLTIMDDTYDNYATLEEADLFTEILE
ncbi:UNVERIFIED_CONTAM: (-)-germacrene D synthase, partial [Sesamum latifolium]